MQANRRNVKRQHLPRPSTWCPVCVTSILLDDPGTGRYLGLRSLLSGCRPQVPSIRRSGMAEPVAHLTAATAASPVLPRIYTPEQRARRDRSRWTLVQGILAPVQFLIFAISLTLVLRYLATGAG